MDRPSKMGDDPSKEEIWSPSGTDRERKKKARRAMSPAEKKFKLQGKRQDAFAAAEALLYKYEPYGEESTFCVFLDSEFHFVSYGESGWDKGAYDPVLLGLTLGQAKSVKSESVGQEFGYGTGCAEPQALVEAAKKKRLDAVAYSLAFDQYTQNYKNACGTCKLLLLSKKIDDLNNP